MFMRKLMGLLFVVVMLGVVTPEAFVATGKNDQQRHNHRHHQKQHNP
jgi:hypothetical protein